MNKKQQLQLQHSIITFLIALINELTALSFFSLSSIAYEAVITSLI